MIDKAQEVQQLPPELTAVTAATYADLEKFATSAEQFEGVIKELTLMSIVVDQLNTIYKDTIYSEDVATLRDASDGTIDILLTSFAKEFISKSEEAQEFAPLPSLNLIAKWVEEIHINVAKQLFSEDFVKEVFTPAFERITAAVLEASGEVIDSDEAEVVEEVEEVEEVDLDEAE